MLYLPGVTHSALIAAAKQTLEANIELSGTERYLTAGRRQFRSLWTRDFLFAANGLALSGHGPARDAQLALLLRHVRPDGAIPRSFDGFSTKARVCLAPVFSPALGHELKPEYLGEHGTPAVDSAPLLILETLRAGSETLLLELDRKLPLLLRPLSAFPLRQPAYSDWQDSARREGSTFYLHLLWWAALRELESAGLVKQKAASAEEALEPFFAGSELPACVLGQSRLSFDGVLLALRFNYFSGERRKRAWRTLRDHPRWRSHPGVPVSEHYPIREISWTTRLVGLRHYHDGLSWTWLLALGLKFAREMQDHEEEQRLAGLLEGGLQSGQVPELLDPSRSFRPFRSPLYRAECPFSWGAGMLAEALCPGAEVHFSPSTDWRNPCKHY
jgi:hypothetical protein